MKGLIAQERIERRIFVIRGHKVMLDRDLAQSSTECLQVDLTSK